ncbi:hypothetical protein A2U01_0089970, partial [Trifolium medium]|nr:hypothetical protein [Trifolium medium]
PPRPRIFQDRIFIVHPETPHNALPNSHHPHPSPLLPLPPP